MLEVRREDGERCGFVVERAGTWLSLTTFEAVLGEHPDERSARDHVRRDGLRALADHWTLVDGTTGDEQVVCIQQVDPTTVVVALDYYSMPGVPTQTITLDDLRSGRWRLDHRA